MTDDDKKNYLSVIGTAYLAPIACLAERLKTYSARTPEDLCPPYENGYSIALGILSVLLAESFIRRANAVLGGAPYRKALEYAKNAFVGYPRLDELEEVFVLRDIIAHNHLWGANVEWDSEGRLQVQDLDRIAGGDKKFARVIGNSKTMTKSLQLRLIPTAICHEDAFKILHEVSDFLFYLESRDRHIFYMPGDVIQFEGNVVSYREFLKRIPDPRQVNC